VTPLHGALQEEARARAEAAAKAKEEQRRKAEDAKKQAEAARAAKLAQTQKIAAQKAATQKVSAQKAATQKVSAQKPGTGTTSRGGGLFGALLGKQVRPHIMMAAANMMVNLRLLSHMQAWTSMRLFALVMLMPTGWQLLHACCSIFGGSDPAYIAAVLPSSNDPGRTAELCGMLWRQHVHAWHMHSIVFTLGHSQFSRKRYNLPW